MTRLKNLFLILLASFTLFGLQACEDEGAFEETGENIDQGFEDAGEGLDEVGDELDEEL